MYYPILSKGKEGFKSFRLEKCQAGPGRYGSHSLALLLQTRPISVELTPSCSFCTHDASHLYKCTLRKDPWRLEQILPHVCAFCHSCPSSLGAPCYSGQCRGSGGANPQHSTRMMCNDQASHHCRCTCHRSFWEQICLHACTSSHSRHCSRDAASRSLCKHILDPLGGVVNIL